MVEQVDNFRNTQIQKCELPCGHIQQQQQQQQQQQHQQRLILSYPPTGPRRRTAAMAIASSSSEQVLEHKVPQHYQITIGTPESIVESLKTTSDRESCHGPPFHGPRIQAPADLECDSCPHCADRCGNENCQTCSNKPNKTQPPSGAMFLGCSDDETYYTLCQIRRHNHSESAWLLVGDTIYDATEYISKHPGGQTSILKKSGGVVDCSVDFDFHSKGARRMWRKYKVGKLCSCPSNHKRSFGTDEQCIIS